MPKLPLPNTPLVAVASAGVDPLNSADKGPSAASTVLAKAPCVRAAVVTGTP